MDREVKMPNIVMHHHFGKVVYSALSDEVKKSIGYIDLYDFATTGPDSFEKIHFFNNKNNNDHKLFSEQMHTKKSKDFFMKMIEMARVDYHMFSYLCGFVTHYFLDVFTNPFINYHTGIYDSTIKNMGDFLKTFTRRYQKNQRKKKEKWGYWDDTFVEDEDL